MNTERNQEIEEYLAELSAIVNLYDPKEERKKEVFGTVAMASFMIICLTIIFEFGVFWGILLLGCGLVPLILYAVDGMESKSSDKRTISVNELAERACVIMSACIDRYKYPEKDIYFIHDIYKENNLALYREFVSIFPHMGSEKLRKLASITLTLKG